MFSLVVGFDIFASVRDFFRPVQKTDFISVLILTLLFSSQAIAVPQRRGLQGAITEPHVHSGCSVGTGTTMSEIA